MQTQETTRLAPSPTGALHLGNARTFLINWAVARSRGWRIVLRIEDLDGPRIKPGAIEMTVDLLRWLGIDWDDGPTIQSADLSPYIRAMNTLSCAGAAYPSDLSRGQIEAAASAPQEGSGESRFPAELRPPIVPGPFGDVGASWRFATPEGAIEFEDEFFGTQRHEPARTVGDFVVWTKRGQPSYQLAVVVDDARQGVTRVVRGDDLLDSAARQLMLYRALGLKNEPRYLHLPLVRGEDGKRLAKRHGDTRLDTYRARGVRAERVIGLIHRWSFPDWRTRERREVSVGEFREALCLGTMSREGVVFTREDDQWLCRD